MISQNVCAFNFVKLKKTLITIFFSYFRQLCMLLSAEDIYRSLAELLLQESNLKFARLMVETLNTILLTTSELFDLRNRLRNLSSQVKISQKLKKWRLCYANFRLTFFLFLFRRVASYLLVCTVPGVIVPQQQSPFAY